MSDNPAFQLDWESVDNITRANLIDIRNGLRESLVEAGEGREYLHEEDVAHYKRYIEAMNIVLEYFGVRS